MGLATIDPRSRKEQRFTKPPSLVLIRLGLTQIQPIKNVKINKEMKEMKEMYVWLSRCCVRQRPDNNTFLCKF